MKKVTQLITVLIMTLLLGLISCNREGAPGPAGKDGVDGTDGTNGTNGTNGKDGNANVRLYNFIGNFDFTSAIEHQFKCSTIADTSNRSVFVVYMIHPNDIVYNVPGTGYYNVTHYGVYYIVDVDYVSLQVTKTSGPGEAYKEVRIFRVFANVGGRGVDNIYNGYTEEQVKNMSYEQFSSVFLE